MLLEYKYTFTTNTVWRVFLFPTLLVVGVQSAVLLVYSMDNIIYTFCYITWTPLQDTDDTASGS